MMQNKKRQFNKYLVTRARMGDRAALEQLVTRYQRKLLGHAYRLLGDAESGRDAVQEGWVDILRGLYKLQDEEAFSVWAFRIITRKCTRHIARLQKNRKVLKNMQGEPGTAFTTSDDIEQALDHRILRKALAKLPDEHRAVIGLFYLEEMSVAEVAVALEIPMGTVKTRLMHGRKKLRATLEGDNHG
jgi:RNA polymerase sigma-70 factor (ECF subfamily)